MRAYLFILLLGAVLVVACACASQPTAAPKAAESEYRPTATIKDIMDAMVDPGADALWDSVAVTVSAKGTEEKAPHTDEEWKDVRNSAIRLVEGTNLLIMPGRHVAQPGEKADDPKVELGPDQIESLINGDRGAFVEFAHKLHDAAMVSLDAVNKKDTMALFDSGDAIDKACENCHLKYWYPNEAKANEAREAGAADPKKK